MADLIILTNYILHMVLHEKPFLTNHVDKETV